MNCLLNHIRKLHFTKIFPVTLSHSLSYRMSVLFIFFFWVNEHTLESVHHHYLPKKSLGLETFLETCIEFDPKRGQG